MAQSSVDVIQLLQSTDRMSIWHAGISLQWNKRHGEWVVEDTRDVLYRGTSFAEAMDVLLRGKTK